MLLYLPPPLDEVSTLNLQCLIQTNTDVFLILRLKSLVFHPKMRFFSLDRLFAYYIFYKKLIGQVGLKDVSSSFAMEQIKNTTALPLPAKDK